MLFYLALFFAFLYFKIARVHRKEEKTSRILLAQHWLVGLAILAILRYGGLYVSWYVFMPLLFLFATMVSLMVTAIQLGIFVDGKPLYGLTQTYKYFPFLGFIVIVFSALLWGCRWIF
ncbi:MULTISPECIES: hypothetical protein [unclassified Sulfuricurvum]|uniref:hypothetical protein n=1 Tax=unclassified Sulfuricurvum TaxID=2632390 RepID=UPI0002997236|nr:MULTISPECIES: hypothetical protein [unclassified Sulfuricurvum]AFV97227.1 hypothetical protein B649_04565 [Candidatus Sulfuricurvum sp. RIFRC-1]HBM34877.1 hypothetical protein [Sulfuricurvum sp.]